LVAQDIRHARVRCIEEHRRSVEACSAPSTSSRLNVPMNASARPLGRLGRSRHRSGRLEAIRFLPDLDGRRVASPVESGGLPPANVAVVGRCLDRSWSRHICEACAESPDLSRQQAIDDAGLVGVDLARPDRAVGWRRGVPARGAAADEEQLKKEPKKPQAIHRSPPFSCLAAGPLLETCPATDLRRNTDARGGLNSAAALRLPIDAD